MIDLLANVERPPAERPRREPPLVPDLEPPERPRWLGSATSEVDHWRSRALAAEGALQDLQQRLASLAPGWAQ